MSTNTNDNSSIKLAKVINLLKKDGKLTAKRASIATQLCQVDDLNSNEIISILYQPAGAEKMHRAIHNTRSFISGILKTAAQKMQPKKEEPTT